MSAVDFPTFIRKYPAKGVLGDFATLTKPVFLDCNPLAASGQVRIGSFVWYAPSPLEPSDPPVPAESNYYGSGVWFADSLPAASQSADKPLGIVHRYLTYRIENPYDGYTIDANQYRALEVVKEADIYVYSTTVATVGQKVFAGNVAATRNLIATGEAGATIANYVETDWVVSEPGAATANTTLIGEVVCISCWGLSDTASAASATDATARSAASAAQQAAQTAQQAAEAAQSTAETAETTAMTANGKADTNSTAISGLTTRVQALEDKGE